MQSTLNEPAAAWEQVAPLLDEAMGRLGETDRNAVVLRFFENKTARETAAALKLNEAAVHKRVRRALEKLRKFFAKRGVTLTAAVIAGAVSAGSVQAAPVGLAATVTAAAAQGTILSATITTLVNTTMKTMTWMKIKLALSVGMAVLVAGGVVTVAVSQTGGGDSLTALQIAKQAQDTYAALSSYSDTGTAVSEGVGHTITTQFNIRLQRPNRYRIDWTSTGGSYPGAGIVWSDGRGDYLVTGAAGQEKNLTPEKMHGKQDALGSASAVSGMAAGTIPQTFFYQDLGDELTFAASGKEPLNKEPDERVGDVDCYVLSSVLDPATLPNQGKSPDNTVKVGITTTTLWIGRQDHLIHQVRESMENVAITSLHETDASLTTILERQKKTVTPEAIAALREQFAAELKQSQGATMVITETHENITVNPAFTPADFAR
jgi:hypothetical protein